ncbi:MG2 domain-containing protein [Siccirubricoccus deserti]
MVKPADGSRGRAAALPVIVTDLGVTAWRSTAGLAAQLRGLQAGRPLGGVRVRLLAINNDILAEAETGADGLVRFAALLLRGQGPMAPKALHATLGDDFVQLDLEAASFDLSDRGATGAEHPGAMDAFLWLDRGIYRPGETVQAAALLRDAGGAPLDIPARFRVRRPNGSVFAEAVPAREPGRPSSGRSRSASAPRPGSGPWRFWPTPTTRRSAGPNSASMPSSPNGWR